MRLDKEDNKTIDGAILTVDSHGDKFQCNKYIPIEEQDVDIMTKALSRGKFEFHWCRIEVVKNPFLLRGGVEKM